MTPIEPPHRVLVVGAGPIGKTAALLLGARGIRSTLLEKGDGLSDEPKAISVDDEALRIYQNADLADEVLRIIVPGLGTYYFDSDSRPLFLGGSPRLGRFGYPFKNPFSQPELEQVLHRAVREHPLVTYLTHHEVSEIVQTPGDVAAVAIGPSRRRHTVTGDYLIGADGGRSLVRSLAGIRMVGRSYPDAWLVIDTVGDPHDERYGLHYGDPRRPHVIVPGRGGRCRYEFPVSAEECAVGARPPLELVQRLLAPYREISADQIERAVVYRFHALNAVAYRAGRVFVAGDAAHMMPPFAGQGLNSGLRDVFNLTWKIAEVLEGRLADAALDSYDSERRPQAGMVVRFSERLGRVVMTENERLARARDRIVREQLADPARRPYFEGMGYRPPLTLREGLLVRAGDAADALVGDALPQPRVFDVTTGRIGLLDDVLGRGWCVLGVQVDTDDWPPNAPIVTLAAARTVHVDLDGRSPRGPRVDRIVTDLDGALAEAVRAARGRFVLVRPDRVVAAVWTPDGHDATAAAVSPWFVQTARSRGAEVGGEPVGYALAAGASPVEGRG